MDLIRTFEGLKTFIKEESDTVLGLVFLIIAAAAIMKYLIVDIFPPVDQYFLHITGVLTVLIIIFWTIRRRIAISSSKFNIGIAAPSILMLKTQLVPSELKRDLAQELGEYIYTSLHFNKEKLDFDKHLNIIKLPYRIKANAKNAKQWCQDTGIDLLIWGDAHYDGKNLFFLPRFEFLREPTNSYYKKFKKSINNLSVFKIRIPDEVQNKPTELSSLLHYMSYLGLMFHGIQLSQSLKFEEANEAFNLTIDSMKAKSFKNKSLTNIHLATRFFMAQNLHLWGSYVLEKKKDKTTALELYARASQSFFTRAKEMIALKDLDDKQRLENTLLYGIYLLSKQGKRKQALKKLKESKKYFTKGNTYLYTLYAGLLQTDTTKAKKYFTKALKSCKNPALCNEKIADYFFAKGEFKESIQFFENRLELGGDQQLYHPELLEEDAHQKLSEAYLRETNMIGSIREEVHALINESKNLTRKRDFEN